jgi:Resolvase, N terminal domain
VTDTSKITASHRERLCLVYVRQSTLAQTRANTESLERQYELAGRAVALGWHRGRVRVVDADLGLSGADAAGREGFQQLVAEVALGRAGLVMGLEASRLARSNSDWYQLLDLCGVTGTLIAGGDGIDDPAAYSGPPGARAERDDLRGRAAPDQGPADRRDAAQGGQGRAACRPPSRLGV